MKKYCVLLCALLCQVSPSHATEIKKAPVEFLGTWTTESEIIYVETHSQRSMSALWEQPKVATNRSTLTITHQEGRRFWGVRHTSDEGSQPFIAIVDPSESSIIAVGPSGSIRGKVLNKNAFTYCYSQIPNKQNDLAYVECTLAKRQR